MARIVIECVDPNDFTSVIESAEQAVGNCTITYAKQHLELVDAGKSKSVSESARILASDSEETPQSVRRKIQKGEILISAPVGQEEESVEESTTNEELEKLEKTQHGGAREGSGRKPQKRNKPAVEDERVTEKFQESYDKMVGAIQNERESGWSGMTKNTALRYADSLVQILTYGA